MTARLIPTASEEEWLAARRAGVTASEIAVIMGLSNWSSPYKLFHQKIGVLPPDDMTAVQERGHVLEPHIADKFAQRHPEFAVEGDGQTLFAHPDRPWQMATPDRLVYETYLRLPEGGYEAGGHPVAGLECKSDASPGDEWGEDGSDQVPVHYRAQVLWNMDVQQVTTWYLACLFVQPWKVRVYEFTLDGDALADLKLMREEARDFLGRIDLGDPPDVDWRPATTETLKRLHPGVEDRDVQVRRMPIISYRAACKAYKAAEQRKKLAENRLRLLLGNGHRIVSAHTGEVIARRDVYPVREHVRKATTVDKLVPVKPKENPA